MVRSLENGWYGNVISSTVRYLGIDQITVLFKFICTITIIVVESDDAIIVNVIIIICGFIYAEYYLL